LESEYRSQTDRNWEHFSRQHAATDCMAPLKLIDDFAKIASEIERTTMSIDRGGGPARSGLGADFTNLIGRYGAKLSIAERVDPNGLTLHLGRNMVALAIVYSKFRGRRRPSEVRAGAREALHESLGVASDEICSLRFSPDQRSGEWMQSPECVESLRDRSVTDEQADEVARLISAWGDEILVMAKAAHAESRGAIREALEWLIEGLQDGAWREKHFDNIPPTNHVSAGMVAAAILLSAVALARGGRLFETTRRLLQAVDLWVPRQLLDEAKQVGGPHRRHSDSGLLQEDLWETHVQEAELRFSRARDSIGRAPRE
jgi:hypothetical protein